MMMIGKTKWITLFDSCGETFSNKKVRSRPVVSQNEITYVFKIHKYFGQLVHSQEYRLIMKNWVYRFQLSRGWEKYNISDLFRKSRGWERYKIL